MLKKTFIVLMISSLIGACSNKEEEKSASSVKKENVVAENSKKPVKKKVEEAKTEQSKELVIYNWPDYISKDLISNFEKETGVKVIYNTYKSNQDLDKLLNSVKFDADIVVPGSDFAKRQIDEGLFQKLEKEKIQNLKNLDLNIMKKVSILDVGNDFLIPWAWGYTTVVYDKNKVDLALKGMPFPENHWDLIFNPKYTSKLKSCKIALMDSSTEVLPTLMGYLGKNPYSNDPYDHTIAVNYLKTINKDIDFYSHSMIDKMSSGQACVGIMWAGDGNIAKRKAIEEKNGIDLEISIPNLGLLFVDTIAIPKNAKNVDNANLFINYYLKPEVTASITNEVNYPIANKESKKFIDAELLNNKTIFLPEKNIKSYYSTTSFSKAARDSMDKLYESLIVGKTDKEEN